MTDAPSFTLPGITGFGRKKPERDKYAGFNRRMLAATIDSALLVPVMPLINRQVPIDLDALRALQHDLASGAGTQAPQMQMLADPAFSAFVTSFMDNFLAQIALLCVFSAVCWHFWSATPGKIVLGMKIADAETGQPMSDRQIILRLLGYAISGACLFMGFFWIGFDRRRQGWHDKTAGTVVLVVPWRTMFKSLVARLRDYGVFE
ncbi:MAG: RDD family protein [Pseudomonadota bacterium]|nr:RDD family protein [Pseudomonadota bacterium]